MYLIVGADSGIGAATLRRLGAAAIGTTRRRATVAPDRLLLDLAQPLGAWRAPAGIEAACLSAAIGRITDCAVDPAASALVNVEQTVALAEHLAAQGIPILFLSSNQVFDGSVAHVEATAPVAPVSEYDRQKVQTETALLRLADRGAAIGILRLAKVLTPGIALLAGWVEALRGGQRIRCFADMMMAPTPVALVATAIEALLRDRATGLFQLSGPEDVSYAEIGRHLARRLGVSAALVEPVPAASAGMPAGSTPRHTTMASECLRERYGIEVPGPWAVIDAALGFTP